MTMLARQIIPFPWQVGLQCSLTTIDPTSYSHTNVYFISVSHIHCQVSVAQPKPARQIVP